MAEGPRDSDKKRKVYKFRKRPKKRLWMTNLEINEKKRPDYIIKDPENLYH